jgi:hypothetical protein
MDVEVGGLGERQFGDQLTLSYPEEAGIAPGEAPPRSFICPP